MNELYFADTYSLFEIIGGNQKYAKFVRLVEIITTRLNLMELYYGLLMKYNEEIADAYYSVYLPRAVNFSDYTIKRAMKFRLANKEKKLSYIDCVGYQTALENRVKFLTGDKAFNEIPNVEFVK